MSRLTLLFDSLADAATIAASSAAATLPAANVQTFYRHEVWRSAGGSPQHLDVTLPAGASVDTLAFVSHNLTAAGTISAQAWTDALDGADQVVDQTVDAWPGGVAPTRLLPLTVLALAASSGARYWRLTFTDPALAYIELGRLLMGVAFRPADNFNWGLRLWAEERIELQESRGGQEYGTEEQPRRFMALQHDWLSDAERHTLFTALGARGPLRPFLVVARPDSTAGLLETALYATATRASLEALRAGVTRAPLEFREFL